MLVRKILFAIMSTLCMPIRNPCALAGAGVFLLGEPRPFSFVSMRRCLCASAIVIDLTELIELRDFIEALDSDGEVLEV